MAKYERQKKYAKNIAFALVGGATGIITQKIINDAITKGQLPNPALFSTVQMADVALAGSEFVAAYFLGKSTTKKKNMASKFLVAMGTGVVAGEVYQWVALQPAWLRLGMTNQPTLGFNGSIGRYGRANSGSVMSVTRNGLSNGHYIGTTYPRR